jgi:nucleoside 2-deoxyribosyltransferase
MERQDTQGKEGKKQIYIAAPLFNESEKAFNKELKTRLARSFDVFLPQEDGGLLVEYVNKGIPVDYASKAVFDTDISALDGCDFLIIVLDGRAVDEGASFELGYAYANGKPCYGLQTDVRRLLPTGNNPMIESSCERIFYKLDDLITWVEMQYSSLNSFELDHD